MSENSAPRAQIARLSAKMVQYHRRYKKSVAGRPKLEKSLPKKAHVTLPADSVLWLHHTGSGDAEEHKQDKQAMA